MNFIKICLFWCLINLSLPASYGYSFTLKKLNIEANEVSVVKNDLYGILAGEASGQENAFNGMYTSKDFGQTWDKAALENKKIYSFQSYGGSYYAGTSKGLFISSDRGISWRQTLSDQYISAISIDNTHIYAGTFANGLWISTDLGNTWQQENFEEPYIKDLRSRDNITILSTPNHIYIKTHNSWMELEQHRDKFISDIYLDDTNLILFNAQGSSYISKDKGHTFTDINPPSQNINAYITSGTLYDNKLWVAFKISPYSAHYLYYSEDLGQNWQNTQIDLPFLGTLNQIEGVFTIPKKLLLTITREGIYELNMIPEQQPAFMKFPWEGDSKSAEDYITSYFDHQYPFLGYNLHHEGAIHATTTMNYLGIVGAIPEIYYSSHNAIDFGLDYGIEITAVADGIAEFYSCYDCGNTIKIDHGNNYQSFYMHLQEDELIVGEGQNPKQVQKGAIIGKVGMTGNTTGPHLHFGVIKDTDQDNSFADEYPRGLVDPFGWNPLENMTLQDPWSNYHWSDITGNHKGAASHNLWEDRENTETVTQTNSNNQNIEIDIANLSITPSTFDFKMSTIILKSYLLPTLKELTNKEYLRNTGLLINAYDSYGNKLTELSSRAKLVYNLSQSDLATIAFNTLIIHYWDNTQLAWVPLPTLIDNDTKTLQAEIEHFSQYAVFGNKVKPTTKIKVKTSSFKTQ